ncbi:MAG: thiamine pyrophosphate-binding protein, partial [Oscillospiraceae bacterium]|nr:thiamine pyrophosphate-binding protein [Oscillospiraceae bacterium]
MKLSGARIIAECLIEQGVDTVFGYPGVSIIRVYDELYKKRGRIRHILTAHEQGAAHAADGYARATGRVGVCLATSGPGATNLITGMAAAFMDSSPVVFITCNVDEALLGRDAFQEVDITGISMPITKCSYLVRSAGELAGTLREAFALASRGRPGPVLVDVTYNATAEKAEYEFLPKEEHFRLERSERLQRRGEAALIQPQTDPEDVAALADMLRRAERPLIMAGGGVIRSAGAAGELRRLCRGHGIPVVSTMMGLGA